MLIFYADNLLIRVLINNNLEMAELAMTDSRINLSKDCNIAIILASQKGYVSVVKFLL